MGFNENGEPLLEGIFVSNSYLYLGALIGLRYQFNLSSNIHLKTDLSYTFYPLTIDKESTFSPYDNATPRNQLMINIGLGINFGKNESDFNTINFEDVFMEKTRSFEVGVYTSFYTFFDGTPLYESTNKSAKTFNHLANSYGVEFKQQINDNWKWNINIEDFEFSVIRPTEAGIESGKVIDKNFWLISGSLLQNIARKNGFEFEVQYGFNYRKGNER